MGAAVRPCGGGWRAREKWAGLPECRRSTARGKPERWEPTLVEYRDVSRADEGRGSAGSVGSCGEFLGTDQRDAGLHGRGERAKGE